jgi:hypothetical protein
MVRITSTVVAVVFIPDKSIHISLHPVRDIILRECPKRLERIDRKELDMCLELA